MSYTLLLAIRGRLLCVVRRARHSFSLTCRVKNGQINYAALYRWILVSLPSRYSSPFINLSPFFVTLDPNESMPAPSRRNVLLRHHAHPCLPFHVGHLYMGLYRYYIFKTGTEVLSIVLHTSSSNTRSCLVCRLKGKTLLLPPHKKREDAHILYEARLKSQLTTRCCCSTFISPPIRQCAVGLSAFLSLCLAFNVCACV